VVHQAKLKAETSFWYSGWYQGW